MLFYLFYLNGLHHLIIIFLQSIIKPSISIIIINIAGNSVGVDMPEKAHNFNTMK